MVKLKFCCDQQLLHVQHCAIFKFKFVSNLSEMRSCETDRHYSLGSAPWFAQAREEPHVALIVYYICEPLTMLLRVSKLSERIL